MDRRNEYRPKGSDALRLGSKGRYAVVCRYPYLSALEELRVDALYKSMFSLFYFTLCTANYYTAEDRKQHYQFCAVRAEVANF